MTIPNDERRLWMLSALLLTVFFAFYAFIAVTPEPTRFDVATREFFLESNPDERYVWGNSQTSRLVDGMALIVWDAVLILLVVKATGRGTGFWFAASLGGFYATIVLLKLLVMRPRPDDAFSTTGAFPSGHVAHFTLAALMLTFIVIPLLRRRVGETASRPRTVPIALVLCALFAAYRVFTGEHWLTDVMGSLLLAPAWVLGTQATLMARKRLTGRPKTIPND